jgi:photosystem II stability/assembly factor-like uncharacterized protein
MRCSLPLLTGLLLACAFPAVARSQHSALPATPYSWQNVRIIAGGFIPGIVFHPREPGLAYVRTDMGGAYRLDRTSPQWVPVTDWVGPNSPNLAGCESIALDPTNPDILYLALGTYSRGTAAIARSADRGKTFALHPVPFTMGANEDGRGMGERLAVDPAHPATLFFGTRHDGLWTSTDSAATWHKVDSFPRRDPSRPPDANRGLPPGGGGVSFVLFDPLHPAILYAGRAEPANDHLFRSSDSGRSWEPIPRQPAAFFPHRAAIDSLGNLFVTYSNAIGPNGITSGAVFKLETASGQWTDITPPQPAGKSSGFGGLALDARRPGTLIVSTIDRWSPGDEIYRTTDSGKTWTPISPTAQRDASLSPYLFWGQPTPRFGWWLAALAIDPFDSDHALYGTGATLWGSHDLTALDRHAPTHWSVAADGIEQTAVLCLISPPEGPHLLSGLGDVGGFTHDDLSQSPPSGMHDNPRFTNTNSLDFAQLKPSLVVRTGTPGGIGAARDGTLTAALSLDSGHTWRPVTLPRDAEPTGGGFFGASPYLVPSSDGSTLLAATSTGAALSQDLGQTWSACKNLPPNLRPIADRAAPTTFYALDSANQRLYTSTNAGETFSSRDLTGLPPAGAGRGRGNARLTFLSSYAAPGDLWQLSAGTLYRSTNAGLSFSRATPEGISVHSFTLGKAPPGSKRLTLFIAGTVRGTPGLFCSTDDGASFTRINDNQHFFGGGGSGFPTVIAADPRIFGRLYLGMNGRGILYGDPLPAPDSPP